MHSTIFLALLCIAIPGMVVESHSSKSDTTPNPLTHIEPYVDQDVKLGPVAGMKAKGVLWSSPNGKLKIEYEAEVKHPLEAGHGTGQFEMTLRASGNI